MEGSDPYFMCGKSGHRVRDFLVNTHNSKYVHQQCQPNYPKIQVGYSTQQSATFSTSGVHHYGRFYALKIRHDLDSSPDMVTSKLQLTHIYVYEILDPAPILFFLVPYIEVEFGVSAKIIIEPSLTYTPVDSLITTRWVYKNFPVIVSQKVTSVDHAELNVTNFYVILGMDQLHFCYALIGCRNRIVQFQFPNKQTLV